MKIRLLTAIALLFSSCAGRYPRSPVPEQKRPQYEGTNVLWGVVVGTDGLPVPEVSVSLSGTPLRVRTDKLGRFKFGNLAPGLYRATTYSSSGRAASTIWLREASQFARIMLIETVSVDVVVLDNANARPVKSGRVCGDGECVELHNGAATVQVIGGRRSRISVSAENYATSITVAKVASGAQRHVGVVVRLVAGHQLGGVLQDGNDKPVPSAHVNVVDLVSGESAATVSDALGRWRVPLPSVAYAVASIVDGVGSVIAINERNLRLRTGANLAVHIERPDGSIAPAAHLVVRDMTGHTAEQTADAMGNARAPNVPLGRLLVFCRDGEFASAIEQIDVDRDKRYICRLGANSLKGRILVAKQLALEIRRDGPHAAEDWPYSFEVQTAEDGRFDVGGIPPGTYSITPIVRSSPIEHASIQVPLQQPIELTASPVGGIEGTVARDMTEVAIIFAHADGVKSAPYVVPVIDGKFQMSGVPVGSYEIVLAFPGVLPRHFLNQEVKDGLVQDLGSVEFSALESVRGHVIDETNGRGVSGIVVETMASAGDSHEVDPMILAAEGRARAETDRDGNFEIKVKRPPAQQFLVAYGTELMSTMTPALNVSASGGQGDIVARGAGVLIVAGDADARESIEVSGLDDQKFRRVMDAGDGPVALMLPRGNYKVFEFSRDAIFPPPPVAVTVGEGVAKKVVLRRSPGGDVDVRTQSPCRDIALFDLSSPKQALLSASCKGGHELTVHGVPAGSFLVCVTSAGSGSQACYRLDRSTIDERSAVEAR